MTKINEKSIIANLPSEYKNYFWDVDWEDLNTNSERFRNFIISRLVDKGDCETIKWLREYCYVAEIAKIVKSSNNVSAKTRHFWKNYGQFLRKYSH